MDHPKKCFICAIVRYTIAFALGIAVGAGFQDIFVSLVSIRF